ncbi:MAG: hypothetical protein JWL81_1760 [Verrucomicrobiales bacterium]|nr:hypothetical protein [Verrucomicrobiales bacterium]
MKPHPAPCLLATLALLTLTAAPAFSAIVVTLPTATVDGSFVITQDINFTITAGGSVRNLVIDEWVTSDGVGDFIFGSYITPGQMTYSLNAGSATGVSIGGISDNRAANAGNVTPNDGYIYLNTAILVSLNDILTVKAATYTLAAGSLPANFNRQTQQTFTGNAFLTNDFGARLSANTPVGTAVPEPGSLGLLALGGLAAATRRRRRPARI